MNGDIEFHLPKEDLTRWRKVCARHDAVESPGVQVDLETACLSIEAYYEMYGELLEKFGLDEVEDCHFEIEATTGAIRRYERY